ncbi:MAG: SdrD B-like domain-containing protein [Bacteroidota bacterium]
MKNIFTNLLCSIILITSLSYSQAPKKGIPRAQDVIPPTHIVHVHNAEIDERSGIPRTLFNVNAGPYSGTPVEIARAYLRENADKLRIDKNQRGLLQAKVSENLSVSHVEFFQTVHDVPVYRGSIVVNINKEHFVTFVSSNYKFVGEIATTPSLDSKTAFQIASEFLKVSGKLLGEPSSALMVYAEEETPKLAYRISIATEEPLGDWEIFIDAHNGEIISSHDNAKYEEKTTGSGYVWNVDPLTSSGQNYGTSGYTDNSDGDSPQLTAARLLVSLKGITLTGGVYKLEGPHCKLLDFESPTETFATPANPDSFRFTRAQQNFEEVNVYFWIDSIQRYLQSMGFDSIHNFPIECDPHGLSGADNSHFIPSSNRLAWGEGGVDDGEDGDVVWHEYGHAIQDGIKPSWGGGETGGLGEGFGDYWGGSISRAVNNNFGRQFFFTWDAGYDGDATGTVWSGRPLNDARSYPAGGVSSWEVHEAGQLWSAPLMELWDDLGRAVMDKLVIKSHYYLSSSPTMVQNAQAIIQADRDIFAGAHVQQLVARFSARNFVNANDYVPQITHTPLSNSENLNGPYQVKATIISGGSPLNTNSLKVFWTRGVSFTDSLLMTATGNANEYAANIPGNGATANYRYYIIAKDNAGGTATHPANAPTNYNSFSVQADVVAPVISHSSLNNQSKKNFPVKISANITDASGIESVWVNYYKNLPANSGAFNLTLVNGNYEGFLTIDTTTLALGDSLFYKITARDNSSNHNVVSSPANGYNKFFIINTLGNILVINDDTTGGVFKMFTEKGLFEVYDNKAVNSVSTNLFFTALTAASYTITVKLIAQVDTSTFNNYDVVIASSGIAPDPMRRADVRTALIRRAQSGKKIWLEGGELGYDFRWQTSGELDKTFRQSVMHDSAWSTDNSSGDVNFTVPSHAIFTTPNILISPFAFTTRTSYADKDAVTLMPSDGGATIVGGWSAQAGKASIIVWDNNTNVNSAAVIYSSFAIGSMTDTVAAKKLITNGVTFLLASEVPTTGAVTGTIFLDANGNGIKDVGENGLQNWKAKVSGTKSDSATTNASGVYTINNLPAGNYTLSEVVQSGYSQTMPVAPTTYSISITVGNTLSGKDFGNFQNGSITGKLFNDTNGNGTLDGGETGLQNWKIKLSGAKSDSVVTDVNGNYTFANLFTGSYTVSEVLQSGWTQSMPVAPGTYSLAIVSGSNFSSKNFGNYQVGSISGMKFNDINGNGAKDAGENGIANWKIKLSGAKTDSVVTDGSGNYSFINLNAGSYTVSEVSQSGWLQTFPPNPGVYSVAIASGSNFTSKNFGNFQYGIISGTAFDDNDGDGNFDNGEPALVNWKIKLNGAKNDSAFTDANGNYIFSNLSVGNYTVSEALQSDWVQTKPSAGTYSVAITSGTISSQKDFGNFHYGTINGKSFNDENINGIYDVGESGVQNRKIKMTGVKNDSTLTDVDGNYSFVNLTAGNYTINEVAQSGWIQTTGEYTVAISSGTIAAEKNFGSIQTGSISGLVFNDANDNATYDEGEIGISDWRVALSSSDTTFTDENGFYEFAELLPEHYTLILIIENGWLQTMPVSPFTYSVDITSGNISAENNFGIVLLGSVSGTIFSDANGNGIKDVSDIVLENWKIILSGAKEDTVFSDENGMYLFENVLAGNYTVTEELPSGWIQTLPNTAAYSFEVAGNDVVGKDFGNFQGTSKFRTFKAEDALAQKNIPNPRTGIPNHLTALNAEFYKLGKAGATFLGYEQTNSAMAKQYGWIAYKKASTMGKMFTSAHTGKSYPLDSLRVAGKKTKKLSKLISADRKTYNNIALEQGIMFNLNLLASRDSVTPKRFGALVLDTAITFAGRAMNGKTLSSIGKYYDSAMTYWQALGVNNVAAWENLDVFVKNILQRINEGFYETMTANSFVIDSAYSAKKYPYAIRLTGGKTAADIGIVKELPQKENEQEYISDTKNAEPKNTMLLQNYPNPFNPQTTLSFVISNSSLVTLKVYDVLGREVATLLSNEQLESGEHEIQFDAGNLTSGVYFYRLTVNTVSETKKLLLMK